MLCAYDPTACGYGGADAGLVDFDGAAGVLEILAEDDPTPEYFGQIAYYRYSAGDLEAGEEAADKALAEASGKQRKAAREAARRAREGRRRKLVEQRKKSAEEGGEADRHPRQPSLSNPFGGLGIGRRAARRAPSRRLGALQLTFRAQGR